jgi:hypothetical protein
MDDKDKMHVEYQALSNCRFIVNGRNFEVDLHTKSAKRINNCIAHDGEGSQRQIGDPW